MHVKPDIAILGAAESGVGAALLAQKQGMNVWVSDSGIIKSEYKQQLSQAGIAFEEETHTEEIIFQAATVVKSPGIPGKAPIVQGIKSQGIELISEIEFASRYFDGKIVAITGSNGKTTVTSLTYEIIKAAGLNVGMAGNIGTSFAAQLTTGEARDIYVLEVSSFQLDDIASFKPHIAILTNITPDHLDRYEYDMNLYAASKMNITRNQGKDDFFIHCADDPVSIKSLKNKTSEARTYAFSIEKQMEEGAWLDDKEHIQIKIKNQDIMSIEELALQGKHNTYNSMASGLAARLLGIRKEVIREVLSGFDSIEHRLEHVLQIYGMNFINDSKATNVNSAWYALESISGDIIWLAGGVDKGNDYSALYDLVKDKVKAIICVGDNNTKLHENFEDKVPIVIDAAHIDEAVRMAYKLGEKGDTVLLSPACASFDRFENYEDRGRQFKEAVRRL
jgi:UDP-N-acetylmuramoylalanine--D-glutamate ligase